VTKKPNPENCKNCSFKKVYWLCTASAHNTTGRRPTDWW